MRHFLLIYSHLALKINYVYVKCVYVDAVCSYVFVFLFMIMICGRADSADAVKIPPLSSSAPRVPSHSHFQHHCSNNHRRIRQSGA